METVAKGAGRGFETFALWYKEPVIYRFFVEYINSRN